MSAAVVMPLPAPVVEESAAVADRPSVRSSDEWAAEVSRVLARPQRSRWAPVVAVLSIVEQGYIQSRFGRAGLEEMLEQAAGRCERELADHERGGLDGRGGVAILLRGCSPERVAQRLARMVADVARDPVSVAGEPLQLTPVFGWTSAGDGPPATPHELARRAGVAAGLAARQLDLVPQRWAPAIEPREHEGRMPLPAAARLTLTVAATLLAGVGVPFLVLVALAGVGIDLGTAAYLTVTGALVVTAATIWIEGFRALDPARPPERPASPYPAATAIVPAYLPNEAATIVETVRHLLAQDYPGELQLVLAYNTPRPLPVEAELRELARADPRLVVLPVPFSTSKAQNVNAALLIAKGEFTGIFDADHHPAPDAFTRAWRWISHGVDMVQGHCVVRNGAASPVARTVAVEFESIYAVSHPGRADLHGFALFGGSSGFWRTTVLRETRMRGAMLTEDIDSSIRSVLAGRRTAMDPALLSYELAPATVATLWNQRLRWAQGWFQVSRQHLGAALRSPDLTLRNKFGMAFLLGWREAYPWLSLQMIPVIAYLAWREGGVGELDFLIPTFLLTTLHTLSVGPGQALFAWRLAAPSIRAHRWWFLSYLVVGSFVYTEFRNTIARVAHVEELTGRRQWVVTPRSASAAVEATP